jgi:hypothetical protein
MMIRLCRRQGIEAEQLRQQQEATRRASEAEKQAALQAMAETVERETALLPTARADRSGLVKTVTSYFECPRAGADTPVPHVTLSKQA